MKRHLLLLPVILGFMVSVYVTIESRSQEKKEYPDSKSREFWYNKDLPFPEINTLKLSGDTSKVTLGEQQMTLKIEFQNCSSEIRQRVKNLLTTNDFEILWEAGKPVEKGVDNIVKFKYKEKKDEVD